MHFLYRGPVVHASGGRTLSSCENSSFLSATPFHWDLKKKKQISSSTDRPFAKKNIPAVTALFSRCISQKSSRGRMSRLGARGRLGYLFPRSRCMAGFLRMVCWLVGRTFRAGQGARRGAQLCSSRSFVVFNSRNTRGGRRGIFA